MSPQTATARAKEINAATQEWLDAGPGRFAGMLVEDASHWEEYGITTGWQLDAYLAHCEYVDLYKSVHGIKPRWTSWEDKTAAEWDLECQNIGDFYRECQEAERKMEDDHRRWSSEVTACQPLTFSPFAGLKL